ncbi:MAG TPA: plastocyanin/azurin family copper-binding protein [Candidatus Limnocylindria bacterium]|nr:plastocyanin/azurin family copper-binding protein [Candidatus Limnocylindria bacterium]
MRRYATLVMSLALMSACGGAPPIQPAATAPSTATPAVAPTTVAPATTASPAATAATALVEMGDHFFAPAQLTVRVGTTVTWKSVGQSTHDLAARDGSFKIPGMSFGDTYSYTFTRAGSYPYVCAQHEGDGMTGTITVTN